MDSLTHTARQDSGTVVSVCISTFRRPEGLRNLLQSLCRQVDALAFEVVVVDNDATRSAAAVADAFVGPLNLVYAVEPVCGLASARNRSVRVARGAFLAFVDDDETVSPAWIASLRRAMLSSGADAVFGPVEFDFEEGVTDAIRRCRLYTRAVLPEGAPLPWFCTYTANVLVRRSSLPDARDPFRVALNRIGGEDIDLFKRMADAGGKFVAGGRDATVREKRELDRANLSWAIRRSLRNGGNLADLEWASYPLPRRLKLALRALATAIRHGLRRSAECRRDALQNVERCIDVAENTGRFLKVFGYHYPEYGVRE